MHRCHRSSACACECVDVFWVRCGKRDVTGRREAARACARDAGEWRSAEKHQAYRGVRYRRSAHASDEEAVDLPLPAVESFVFFPSLSLGLAPFFPALLPSSVFFSAVFSSPPSLPSARLRRLPPLKSVSYQPPPFSRKRGAETRLRNAGLPHAGQSFSGASLSFCSASSVWPQDSHSYS